jgi:hypothetical protein
MANVAAHQARPQADVIAEINSWFDNFGSMLLGIFFDEVDSATVRLVGGERCAHHNPSLPYTHSSGMCGATGAVIIIILNPSIQFKSHKYSMLKFEL